MAFYPGQERIFGNENAVRYSLLKNVDYFHMMSYDNMKNNGKLSKHSTFEFGKKTVDNAVQTVFGRNDEIKNKLTMGVPFYARHMKTGDWKTYEEIVKNTMELDQDSMDANNYNKFIGKDQWNQYYYNGVNMIVKKTNYAIEQNIGGIMIWEVGQDVNTIQYKNLSLLVALHKTVQNNLLLVQSGDESDKDEL